ncbi:hypothetical protein [Clostridium akagii]|uniref:hypothetical protein n=1 Tax=Clostridium akagii TaxID=91623 RepID=UPI00047E8A37|nr:hypothetical protein [Clostridium akagii]
MNSKKAYIIEIKVLYDLCIFNFAFIIWSILTHILFVNFTILFYIGIVVILGLIVLKHFKYLSIDYDSFRCEVRNMLLILAVSIMVLFFSDLSFSNQIFKFYMGFIIFSVLLLRNTRDLLSNLNNKKSMRNSVFIAIFILFLSVDGVLREVLRAFYILLKFLNYIFDTVTPKIIYVIISILGALFNKIKIPQIKQSDMLSHLIGDAHSKTNITKNHQTGSIYVDFVIKIVLALLIVIIIYFIIIRFLKDNKKKIIYNNQDGIIEVENIIYDHKKKEKINVFMKGLSPNEKIKIIYLKFEKLTNKKGIFKFHHTATELSRAAKEKSHLVNELDHISEIYNKTKFSNVESDEIDFKAIEREYYKVKKSFSSSK